VDKKRIPRYAFLILVLGASLPLLGCGGSGGGGGTSTSSQNTYTISGTVSGLSGTGLALQNNGSDYLLITGSGSFSFDKPIPSGGVYNVTIDGEPDNPIQLCLVANGSGSANANITSVQVTCTTPVEKALYNFGDAPDGISPQSNLVFDSSGNLYGTTIEGGLYGSGTVFKLTPSQGQWTETVLYSFCSQTPNCTDGGVPHAGLVFDAEGNLYGTASQRGATNGGVVFELMPHSGGSWTESVLHSFGNGTDGSSPYSGVFSTIWVICMERPAAVARACRGARVRAVAPSMSSRRAQTANGQKVWSTIFARRQTVLTAASLSVAWC